MTLVDFHDWLHRLATIFSSKSYYWWWWAPQHKTFMRQHTYTPLLFFLAGGISEISNSYKKNQAFIFANVSKHILTFVRDSLCTLAWRPGIGIDFLDCATNAAEGSCTLCEGAFSCAADPLWLLWLPPKEASTQNSWNTSLACTFHTSMEDLLA